MEVAKHQVSCVGEMSGEYELINLKGSIDLFSKQGQKISLKPTPLRDVAEMLECHVFFAQNRGKKSIIVVPPAFEPQQP